MKPLGFASEYIYSLSRAVTGALLAQHGAQKLFGALGADRSVELFSQLGLAGVIELGAGTLIMLGLYTPLGRVPRQRSDGVGLFHCAQPAWVLADHEWRRAGGFVLLRVSLLRDARLWAA